MGLISEAEGCMPIWNSGQRFVGGCWSRFCVSVWAGFACGVYSARQGAGSSQRRVMTKGWAGCSVRCIFRSHGRPCGSYTDPTRQCRCTPYQIQRYVSKISGPLIDRIDIHVEVPRVKYRELKEGQGGATSADIRGEVAAARAVQAERFKRLKIDVNARMSSRQIKNHCELTPGAERLLASQMESENLSARAYTRVLKVARTIADLASADGIKTEHVAEAIQYRRLDRDLWA